MHGGPGVIEPGQIAGDIIHETDLLTTFANLAGAKQYIPTDCVIDGVDQTAIFLEVSLLLTSRTITNS